MEPIRLNKKLKKEKPNKKWSPEEIKIILDYLESAENIETPTAQIFYKKFIEESGIDATWDIIRWKVRYLKASYKKANDWRNSTGAGLLESDKGTSCVEAKVLQICPHYEQLSKIFGEKRQCELPYNILDTGEIVTMDDSFIQTNEENATADDENFVIFDPCEVEISIADDPQTSEDIPDKIPKSSEVQKKAKEFAEKMKKYAPKSSAAYLAAFQAERTALFKMKYEWEKEKHQKEVEFNKKKFELEEEKTKFELEIKKQELQLKAREIERDERLKIMEMEKDERIKKYEIEMKYKNKP